MVEEMKYRIIVVEEMKAPEIPLIKIEIPNIVMIGKIRQSVLNQKGRIEAMNQETIILTDNLNVKIQE